MDGRELSAYRIVSAIRASSSKLQPIPNAVHFFLFYPRQRYVELKFHHYVALLSAAWLSGTDFVILWCSAMPDGHYWHQLKSNLTAHGKQNQLLLATRPLPKRVFNRNVRVIQHQVDVMKLETGITIGGIILDTDVLTLRSLQPLRRFDCVIGRESSIGLTIGAFMTKPGDIFLMLWYMLYQTFDDRQWAQHSVLLPQQIWQRYPHLCRVENQSFARPGWTERELSMLYGDLTNNTKIPRWNWSNNHLLHLWRFSRPAINETSVRRLNSMFGQVVRYILYGSESPL
uniref:Nucleotid_trans domain-containing protein n=1 Tax=Macrostomum lignano TaxID=282301 RepID=A0A1I8IHM1_9PLAT